MYYSQTMHIESGYNIQRNSEDLTTDLSSVAELVVISRELYCILDSALGSEIKSASPEAAISLWRSNMRGHHERLLALGHTKDDASIILEDTSRMADMLEQVLLELRVLRRERHTDFDDISGEQDNNSNVRFPIALL